MKCWQHLWIIELFNIIYYLSRPVSLPPWYFSMWNSECPIRFDEVSAEIETKQILASFLEYLWTIGQAILVFSDFHFQHVAPKKRKKMMKLTKTRDENLMNIGGQRGAKECIHFHSFIFILGPFLPKDTCKSDRSRQELSNEYLAAKFGFDTAEKQSSKAAKSLLASY